MAAAWLAVAIVLVPVRAAESFAQQLLSAGEKELEDLRHAEGVAYLSEALKLAQASTSPADRALLPRIYELRAVGQLSLGDGPAAERDFAALVEIDPTRDLDRVQTSPKILEVFDRVRAARTGAVTLNCDPPDCRLSIVARNLEIQAPVVDRRLPAGRYEVQIGRPGFEPVRETWTVQAGQRIERQINLVSNSQSFQVLTIPPGSTVLLDGVVVGESKGPAPAEFEDRARKAGVTLAEMSGPLLVPHVTVGKHELRIERRCHQSARFGLEVKPEMRSTVPITFKPVRLKAELSRLDVQTAPPGGEVRLDGKVLGKAPLRRDGVCAGQHDLEVLFPTGARWTEKVELPAGAEHHVQAQPRPTVAFMGLVQVGSEVRADSRVLEAGIRGHLQQMRSFNIERRDRDEASRKAWPGLVSAAPLEVAGTGEDLLAARLGEWARTSPKRGSADLFLGVVLRRRGEADEVRLYVASALGAPAEIRRAAAASPESLQEAFRDLDRPLTMQETWTGWVATDAPLGGPPILTAVAVDSPAARAGLVPGDTVRALDNEPVGDAAGLGRLLAATAPGEVVQVGRLSQNGTASTVRLIPVARPRVLPLDSPDIVYHAAHAHLKYALLGQADPVTQRLAALNLGIVLVHFGRVEQALQSYLQPRPGGVLEAAEQFVRALALQKAGNPAGARQAFTAAAQAKAVDLEPAELPVSILAAEALRQSSPTP